MVPYGLLPNREIPLSMMFPFWDEDRQTCHMLIMWWQSRGNFGSLRWISCVPTEICPTVVFPLASLVTNILFLLQIFCLWNPLWLLPFVHMECVIVFVFCDCVKISLWLRCLMHSSLVTSLNLFSAWISHNFLKCKILKEKKKVFQRVVWFGFAGFEVVLSHFSKQLG